jgi:hypothetical protein
MLSPSGKVEWLCSQCKGREIVPVNIGGQRSFACSCGYFAPWRSRLKRSQSDAAGEQHDKT